MGLFRFFGTAGRARPSAEVAPRLREIDRTAAPPPRSTTPPAPGLSEAERRELELRRELDEAELIEGLQATPIPESSDPAVRWAESGEWHSVSSSNVSAIQYDHEDERLLIEYHDGSIYAYAPVRLAQATDLFSAPSKGRWVWDNLRVRGGPVFAYQVPYELLSGPSQRTLGVEARKWMKTEESRQRHGDIGPSGRDASGRKIRPRDLH